MIHKETKHVVEFNVPAQGGTYRIRLSKSRHLREIIYLREYDSSFCLNELGEKLLSLSGMRSQCGVYNGIDFLNYLQVRQV